MSILAVAALPAAAAATATPADVVRDALRVPDGVGTRVLLAAGEAGVVHDRAVVEAGDGRDVAPDGGELPADGGDAGDPGGSRVELTVDTGLLAALAGRSGFARGRTDRLGGDLARLIRWCARFDPARAVLPVEVPAEASGGTLEAVAAGLRGAAADHGRDVAVTAIGAYVPALAAGGGAGAPAATGEDGGDAHGWQRRAVAALRAGDADRLCELGPREARRVGARGWAPVTVAALLASMAGLPRSRARFVVPDGIDLALAP